MSSKIKKFTISSGDAIGGSISYIVGEKLEISGGDVTAPKANVSDLAHILRVTGTDTIIIGGAFGGGAEIKVNDTATSPKVKAGDAIGGSITYTKESLAVTAGRAEGIDTNAVHLTELAKITEAPKVIIRQASAQGATISGEDEGEDNETDSLHGEHGGTGSDKSNKQAGNAVTNFVRKRALRWRNGWRKAIS